MIKVSELNFCSPSVADTFGRVFEYHGEIFRMIYKGSESECKDLLGSELFKILIQQDYIPNTFFTDEIEIEGNPLVIKHEKCFIIKPYEWTFEMYKDAACFILELNNLCGQYGYELKDAHPFNVTFNNGRPIFIDIGSIIKKTGKEWIAKYEFLQITCLPLILWTKGELSITRNLLESNDMYAQYRLLPQQSFLETPFFKDIFLLKDNKKIRIRHVSFTTNNKAIVSLFVIFRKISKKLLKKKIFHITDNRIYINPTLAFLRSLSLPYHETEWEGYQSHENIEHKYPRFLRITNLIKRYCSDAHTAIDLAGNGGNLAISLYKANIFKHIFTVDYDGNASDKAYKHIKSNQFPIDTIYSNIIYPFDPRSFYKRVQSDIAIACALTHHLVLRQNIPLYAVFEKLSAYTRKYIVVEFMPLGLWDGSNAPPTPEWYTEEWFSKTFEKYFTLLHKEQLESNRIVYIGKKSNLTLSFL